MSALLAEIHNARKERLERMNAWHGRAVVPRDRVLSTAQRAKAEKLAEKRQKESSTFLNEQSAPELLLCNRPASSVRKELLRQVIDAHKIEFNELISDRRNQKLVKARFELYWKLKTFTSMSYPEIGRFLGGRDHTTILYGVRKYAREHDLA